MCDLEGRQSRCCQKHWEEDLVRSGDYRFIVVDAG